MRYLMGLDLAQSGDFTALCVVRQAGQDASTSRFEVIALKRYTLGTGYPEIVEDVAKVREREEFQVPGGEAAGKLPLLVVDATGVGRPVVDMFRRAKLQPVAITITGGNTVNTLSWHERHVPKRDLVSALQVLFHSDRLAIAGKLPEAPILKAELQNFRATISLKGHDSYGAGPADQWREGAHDDLVLCVALACWAGGHVQRKELRFL